MIHCCGTTPDNLVFTGEPARPRAGSDLPPTIDRDIVPQQLRPSTQAGYEKQRENMGFLTTRDHGRDQAPIPDGSFPPDLAELLAAWPALPDAIKAGILAMIRSAAR